MKEVTYKDWIKNTMPRMMWCWNYYEKDKVKRKVIHILRDDSCMYPILSVTDDDFNYETYQHCAEIKYQRRMTNKELSRWLREKPTREYRYSFATIISCTYSYSEFSEDEEVEDNILIREGNGEWREPLIDIE